MADGVTLQRRLFDRYAAHEFGLGWNVTTTRTGLRRRQVSTSVPGKVLDVSVVGASVLAPADDTIVRGRTVVIDVDGQVGSVLVRNVRATDDPGTSVYGFEFRDLTTDLQERFLAPIESERRHVSGAEWTGELPDA